MNNDTVAYDLLCKVFAEFFKQMRREPNRGCAMEVIEMVWQEDWDKLRGPVLNHIEEALEVCLEIESEHIPPYPKTRPRPAGHPPDKGGENE